MEMQKYEEIKIFKDNISSFKETSRDSDGDVPGYMTNSEIQVINFDKVKESYIREMNLSNTPCSNDALYIGKDKKIYFKEVFTYTESEFENIFLSKISEEM